MSEKLPIVEVTWLDARAEEAWIDIDEAKEQRLYTCVSIGYLLHEDEDKLIIIQSQALNQNTIAGLSVIPKSGIQSVKNKDS